MRKILYILIITLLLSGCVRNGDKTVPTTESVGTSSITEATHPTETNPPQAQHTDFKAMWLSQYDLWDVYLSDGVQRDREDFAARMAQILDNIKAQGFNTVLLQVRPNGDSMYPSAYYPMSKYVVGEYGRAAAYDPVRIIVGLAKERELSLHAWINPMRCMKTEELEALDDSWQIRQWYEDPRYRGTYIVQHGAYWYLNPAYDEVRQLILNGAAELLEDYAFDGLHMDDYFYPTTEVSFDEAAYEAFGTGRNLAEFRRENLNHLVSGLYAVTKDSGEGKIFGISPAGNIQTVYNNQYADVYTWCSMSGYVDYICPQVYFGMEHQSFDFVSVCNTWQDIIVADSVDLIIGMTFEKALSQEDPYAGTGKNEWMEHKDVLKRCLEYTGELPQCRGISVFSYQHFFNPVTGEPVAGTAQEREQFVPALQKITWLG